MNQSAPERSRRVRRRARIPLVLAAAAALTAGACTDDSEWERATPTVASATATELERQLSAIVEEELVRSGAPGIVAAVRFADGSEWVDLAGVADLATGAAIDADATWPLRSVTKSFAVTVLLQLAEEGIVALDDPVSTYVEGVPDGDDITLAQLAEMSSGLPEYANDAFVDAFVEDTTRVFSDDELLGFIDGEPSQFSPGDRHVYTNTNTLLVGMVIESATGQPLEALLAERILAPLELTDTQYRPDAEQVLDAVPAGYQPDGDEVEPAPFTLGVFGASGAMTSTVADLLDWGPVLARGELLADGGERQRSNATPLDDGPEYDRYGAGIGDLDGWWGHTGEGLGYTTLVMSQPDTGATVVVLANISNTEQHVPTAVFRAMAPLLEGD